MALLGLRDVRLAFGGPPLLDQANLALERGERVCLLGRNGAGKSTLMQLLDGTLEPDAGEVVRQGGLTVARLEQEIPDALAGTTYDVVAGGLGEVGRLLARYHDASHRVAVGAASGGGDAALRELDRLHHQLDAAGAWQVQTRVETVLEHLALDEPTNHLDVEAIEWMEEFLVGRAQTLLFVTHDRAFLRRVATRIVELDRGRLADWGSDYDAYLVRKREALDAESRQWAEFDRKLAAEERWVGTSITARRTRNEGRVRALEAMRRERAARRQQPGAVRMQAQEGERSGRLVIEARGVDFAYPAGPAGARPIVRGLATTIMRGDRVGFVGPNGSGKTTLVRLLLGELVAEPLAPDAGTVRHGTGLQLAYFDQLRERLDPDRTVFDSIADGADWVELPAGRRHVSGYLQEFLFPPDRARTPVRALSGGERNRLLLARLFTRTFNLLVLDEPTNDLDVETLELLEALLVEYEGTLLLVSHDRAFLDNVVTSTLVMEGAGRVGEYVGGYSDWVRQRPAVAAIPPQSAPKTPKAPKAGPAATPTPAAATPGERRRRLSFKETRELAELPDRIDAAERAREAVYASLADPALLRDGAAAAAAKARLAELDAEVEALTLRWEALETLAAEVGA